MEHAQIATNPHTSFIKKSERSAKNKIQPCRLCKLETYSPDRICALCDIYGPSHSKRIQRENNAALNKKVSVAS